MELTYLLAKFVYSYSPKGIRINNIHELTWHIFCKAMDRLPPTMGSIKQHILRPHIQTRIRGHGNVACQQQIDPMLHVFIKDSEGIIRAHTTDYLPVPKAVIEIVRCRCKTDCASNRSSYKYKDLSCIEMCCCTEQC